ncbi:MAG TPA: carbamate kinase, partial [Bacteroidota bacterium]|nr:carbamate kinase [Bacteroidota bacterium]
AFKNPTKPIGPFYSKEIAEQRERELGWKIVEDAARGYRRVVPSPKPLDVVEIDAIERCVKLEMVVIAAGGGGIPVIRENGKYIGIEAVIDKDRASALLARELQLERFVISTDTDRVYLNYKKPNQYPLEQLSLNEIIKHYKEGHFPAGSMGPKIEAAIDFLSNGGKEVIITNPENIVEAVFGNAGTHIVPDGRSHN